MIGGEPVFVDTGPLLARHLAADGRHEEALRTWDRLERAGRRWFTSSLVLSEVATLLARRADAAFAAARVRAVYRSSVATLLRPGRDEELEALRLLETYADQRVGFTDCTSFVLMRSHGLTRAFTFDHHFVVAGFRVIPGYGEAGWLMEESGGGDGALLITDRSPAPPAMDLETTSADRSAVPPPGTAAPGDEER